MAEAPSAAEVHSAGGMRQGDRDQPMSITETSKPSATVVIGLTGPQWLGRKDRESYLSGIGHRGRVAAGELGGSRWSRPSTA
jgi:hypothetical protein